MMEYLAYLAIWLVTAGPLTYWLCAHLDAWYPVDDQRDT